ncbi:MFS transporter [Rhodococcoides fascians A21d2]|uniref:MFS transporter n=1 Tax=Nocardiaceae TaxID=85025 RepID=UPI00055AF9C2|nr:MULTISPECIES: MFS transporter [Rhodococcus]OZC51596.1 MFS transporter [Rhodococcus sp. WWJCD1]QIH99790.1 MFS transporter [Rhodococcus fascians A21d2]
MSAFVSRPSTRWWALVVLSLTELVVVLDVTIVTIALPEAQQDLNLSDTQRQWVVTAYALAFGALLLLGGRVADYWGRKRTFMVGMVGFGAASAWGGIASNGTELVIARAVQGTFAALLAPAALAMLTVIFTHGRERNLAFAIFGTIAGTGAAVGLVLGGVLTEFASWRWCLLVNVVFVVIGIIGGLLFLGESKADGDNRYDLWGAVTVTLGLGSLVYGFTLAEHGWSSADTVVFLGLGVVLLAAFVWIQTKVEQPLLPLRVLLHGVRGGAFLVQAVVGAIMIGSLLYLTFHFQIVMGMSPLVSGLANVTMTVVIIALVPVVTKALNTYGPRPLMIAGPLFAAAGLLYLSDITPDGDYVSEVLPALILLGVGLAMLFVPLQNLALTGVDPQDAGVASATVNSTFHIGGSIGLAVFTVIYARAVESSLAAGKPELTAFTDGYSATFIASAVAMVVASALSVAFIRGDKNDLIPRYDSEEAPVHTA